MKSIKHYILSIGIIALAAGCAKDSNSGEAAGTKNDNGTGQGGSLARFALVGDHMYAVNGNSLKVFNLSDPADPNFVSTTNINADVETIFARDEETMFIGSRQGMFAYDVSNAPNVEQLGSYSHVTSCDPVVANSDYAYVTLRTRDEEVGCNRGDVNQLDVVDISNLNNMQVVHSVQMEFPIGLGLYGDTLLVCDEGLKVYDVSKGDSPQFLTKEELNAVDIIPYNDLMIVSTVSGIAQYRFKNGKLEFLSSL